MKIIHLNPMCNIGVQTRFLNDDEALIERVDESKYHYGHNKWLVQSSDFNYVIIDTAKIGEPMGSYTIEKLVEKCKDMDELKLRVTELML